LVQRRGYAGDMRVTIPNIPAGFKVAGGNVPVEAAQQDYRELIPGRKAAVASLTITAPPDAKPQSLDLQVLVEAHTEDGLIRRWARGPGLITAVRGDKQKPFTAPWLGMHLPMSVTDPLPLKIAPATPLAHFAQGFEFELKYEVTRTGSAKAPIKVVTQTLGAVGNLRILAGDGKQLGGGKNTDKGTFLLDTNFATPFSRFDMAFDLQTEIDGKPVNITSPIMEIEVAPGYTVKLAKNELALAPGGTMDVAGTIYREPTFEGGLIKLQAEDLPENVTCAPVEAAASEQQFKLSCTAGDAAKPGKFPIRISSVAPETGKKAKAEYKIPDLSATLQVGKGGLASK
jgi:hypothetical protein